MADETEKTRETRETRDTRGAGGSAGRPNGRTARAHALKQMSAEQRKAHRKTWRAAAKPKRSSSPKTDAAAPPTKKGKG